MALINNRPKFLHLLNDMALVVDDSGGECITSFSDDEAVELFLEWLHEERERRTRLAQVGAHVSHNRPVDTDIPF